MIWPLITAVLLTLAFWLKWRHKNQKLLEVGRKLPGPPALPFVGNALLFIFQPNQLLTNLIRQYGDLFRFWLGPDLNVVVNDPDLIKTLLLDSKTNAKGPQYKYMREILGEGILSGSGIIWKKHRKLATPNYGKLAIEAYTGVFNHEVDILLQKCRQTVEKEFDIYKYIVQTTSYCVCRTLYGLNREQTLSLPHLQTVIDATPTLYDIVFSRMTKWYLKLNIIFWLTPSYRQVIKYKANTKELAKKVIAHRQVYLQAMEETNKNELMNSEEDGLKNSRLSVIDRFILSQEFDEEELWKETFTIFTSSQEAAARIASAVVLMVAFHPDCQEKLYAEIKSTLGEKDGPVTGDHLRRMPYLDMVVKEVVRLFPIGALLQRTVLEDIDIGIGVILPAGCSLAFSSFDILRDPRHWSKPNEFNPERFTPENTKLRHPYSYIPFSLGPMNCFGRYFGLKLVKTITLRLIREFTVTSSRSYENLNLSVGISAISSDGYHVMLTPRRH